MAVATKEKQVGRHPEKTLEFTKKQCEFYVHALNMSRVHRTRYREGEQRLIELGATDVELDIAYQRVCLSIARNYDGSVKFTTYCINCFRTSLRQIFTKYTNPVRNRELANAGLHRWMNDKQMSTGAETLNIETDELLDKLAAEYPREHLVFTLKYVDDMTIQEIMGHTGLSIFNVNHALRSARIRLRRYAGVE